MWHQLSFVPDGDRRLGEERRGGGEPQLYGVRRAVWPAAVGKINGVKEKALTEKNAAATQQPCTFSILQGLHTCICEAGEQCLYSG